jgi:hypothetical protein
MFSRVKYSFEDVMAPPLPDINAALSSDGPIRREQVTSWIDTVEDSDLQNLSKLYRLTGEGYYRIQPELGMGPTCALIQRYLIGCVRDGVTGSDEIQERYEAAQSLHVWFRQLAGVEDTLPIVKAAAEGIKKLYLQGDEDVRTAIETGFLEHAMETAALRPYFEDWASDQRLKGAWKRALEWGNAHPDYMAKMFQRLQSTDQE